MAISTLLSFAFRAIANVVRRLYRLNTDIHLHSFPCLVDFLLYIYCAVFLAKCVVLGFSPIFRAFSEVGGGRKYSTSTKTLPSSRSSTNGIEINANESTIHNNNTAERTKYDETTITMTRFTRKSNSEEDVTGFSSPYLCSRVVLNSGHPVQKSKCGACAVMGYCSFNGQQDTTISS